MKSDCFWLLLVIQDLWSHPSRPAAEFKSVTAYELILNLDALDDVPVSRTPVWALGNYLPWFRGASRSSIGRWVKRLDHEGYLVCDQDEPNAIRLTLKGQNRAAEYRRYLRDQEEGGRLDGGAQPA